MIKMYYYALLSLLILFSIDVCVEASDNHDPVSQLRWLDDTNASEAFANDVKADKLRFYAVYGYGKMIVGIGWLNYDRCYAKYVPLETIEGTSDSWRTMEHFRLNKKACDFSREYNVMMRDYLIEHGLSDCPKGVDWNAAFYSLTRFVWETWEITPEEKAFLQVVLYQFDLGYNVDFEIRLKDPSRSRVVKRKACQIFAEYGIESSVRFKMTKYEIGMKEEPSVIDEFVCRGGKIVENRTLPPKHKRKKEK